jgi:hypothetical protein
LSGKYGQETIASMPSLALDSVRRTSTTGLTFSATANGKAVEMGPFYDAQGFNYNVYWGITGSFAT